MHISDIEKRLIEHGLRNELRWRGLLTPARVYVANKVENGVESVLVSFGTQNVIGEATVPAEAGGEPIKIKTPIAWEIHGSGSPTLDAFKQVLEMLEGYVAEVRERGE